MIPLHLSIEGLYSYQTRQEIDFGKLTQAQLFGIFGSTGSGKSSILEAITYALYGQSDRLNQRDNRGYNMMNLRSDRLLIEFRFEVEEEEYLFSVNGRRNSKRFEDVRTLERTAYKIENGVPVPIEENAESVLGLSYENFRRTIIVPQGKFQEFLQLTDTERTRMMREIFHLERFELYRKTLVLEQGVNTEMAQTASLIAQFGELDAEKVQEKQEEVLAARQNLAQLEKSLKESERMFQQQDQLRLLFEELDQSKQEVARLNLQAEEMKKREEQLEAYEQCLLTFKPLLDRKKELLNDHRLNQRQIEQKKDSQAKVLRELQRVELNFQKVSEEFQNREQWSQKAEELRTVISLKKVEENVQALSKRISDGTDKIARLKQEIIVHKQEQTNREHELKELRNSRPEIKELMPIRDWHQKIQQLQQLLSEAEKDLLQFDSKKEGLQRSKYQILSKASISQAQYALPTPQLLELLNSRWESEQKALEQDRLSLEKMLADKKIGELIDQLEEGSPCPLCGSTEHPMPFHNDFADDQEAILKQQIKTQEAKLKQLQASQAQLDAIHGQETQLAQEGIERQQRIQGLQRDLDQQRSTFTWGEEMTEDYINEQLEKINQTDILIKEINLQRDALLATIDNKDQTLAVWQKGLEKINQDYQQEEIALQVGKKSLQYISYEARKVDLDASIEELALEYDQNSKRVEESYHAVETQINQLRSRKDTLLGEIKGLDEQGRSVQTQLAQKNLEIDRGLSESRFQRLEEVEQLLTLQLDLDKEKTAIREFAQNRHAAQTQLLALQEKVKGKHFSKEAFLDIQHQIQKQKEEKSTMMVEVGSLQKEQERLQKDLSFKQQQEKKLANLQLRKDNLLVLKRMFHKSGFVNFVSTMYLQNLCRAANDRFMKLTRGSLSLETTESNSFLVRDYLNNGQTRSVKTLSGGQTFQAALSLALALADQVQQQAKNKQNFFFLDEGFGSQDKASLQIIFQTLKSLRQENRIVGIISHVEELQQEISAFLHIRNDVELGSMVKGSWE
ncbi:MAG: SMC family ATPase [Bacteroidota bacterium]